MKTPAYLPEYPHLPVLAMKQCTDIFKACRLGPSAIARYTGYSRMAVHRWMKALNHEHNDGTLFAVSSLAYKCLRACIDGYYPIDKCAVDPLWLLKDVEYERNLQDYTYAELAGALNLLIPETREADATT